MKLSIYFVLGFLMNYSVALSQFTVKNDIYNTFDGRKIDVWLIEGKYVVLNIDKREVSEEQLADTSVINKILIRSDSLYGYYIKNMGYEPVGGNEKYSNKCNVFFGPPSCGSGCGLIGAKGIEVSGFENIFYGLKYNLNINRDVIIAYEFGRNFFTFSDKILFPFTPNTDEKNGGFAEGFADVMYQYAYHEIITDPKERTLNETLLNIEWAKKRFRGYINDTTANPYNCLAKWDKEGVLDPNRGVSGHFYSAYPSNSLLIGIFETFDRRLMFPSFFKIIKERPSVKTIEDALSNIAYASSKSINKNLGPFFKNVLKFKLNKNVEEELSLLPSPESKLVKDESVLWFLSPFEKINLNLIDTNYLVDNGMYKVIIDGKDFSNSIHGNNVLTYDLLRGKSSISVSCQLIINNKIVDQYSLQLRKRHNVDIFEFKSDFYAYYLSNNTNKSFFEGDNLVLEDLQQEKINYGLIKYNLPLLRERNLKISGQIRQITPPFKKENGLANGYESSGFSNIILGSPERTNGDRNVGTEVGLGNNNNFFNINFSDHSSLYFFDNRKYILGDISFRNQGFGLKSYYKNVVLKDITDTDNDGIVDFEDNCPLRSNIDQKDTDNDGVGDTCDIDLDGDGVINETDLCKNTPLGLSVDAKGCALSEKDSDNDGINDDKDLCPNSLVGTNIDKNGCTIVTSVLEDDKQVVLSPNPFLKNIKIEFPSEFGYYVSLEIVDLYGKLIFNSKFIKNKEWVNLSELPKGVFIIKIISENKRMLKTMKVSKIE